MFDDRKEWSPLPIFIHILKPTTTLSRQPLSWNKGKGNKAWTLGVDEAKVVEVHRQWEVWYASFRYQSSRATPWIWSEILWPFVSRVRNSERNKSPMIGVLMFYLRALRKWTLSLSITSPILIKFRSLSIHAYWANFSLEISRLRSYFFWSSNQQQELNFDC